MDEGSAGICIVLIVPFEGLVRDTDGFEITNWRAPVNLRMEINEATEKYEETHE